MSGLCDGMRAPFDLPKAPIASMIVDPAGRKWRVSAPVGGIRLAVADLKEEPDAAHRFTAAVSHEIRTPLNGIMGMAALLQETELSPSQKEYAAAIRKSGARLLDLLNNVLDYSRLVAGDIPLDAAPFSPSELVQDVAELLSPRAHAAGLDIAAAELDGLAPILIGDASRIGQILFNLVGNAIKFTESGSVLVEAGPRKNGDGLILTVRDTGPGIPEGARARLFHAFGQVSAADARKDGGVGLGLAICARLVASMKGDMTFMSREGEGASFIVDLPLLRPKGSLRRAPPPVFAARKPVVALRLHAASAIASALALAREGAQTTLDDPDATRADLVLIDAAEPPARIEALARRRRTLVVLRPEDRSLIERFRELGCAGYLIRPLRAASVLERVRHALDGDVAGEPEAVPKPLGSAGRVLIADDNPVNALLVRSALSAAGYLADVAGTGSEALELASDNRYDLIFMDVRMPVMDGLEATRRIRRLGGAAGATPIIALTADIDPVLEQRAHEAGVTSLAAKPIDPARLRRLAETYARSAEATP
jgi:hypothetical protein